MTRITLPDTWWSDPRILALSTEAQALYPRLLAWSGLHRTDGRLPRASLGMIAGAIDHERVMAELVRIGEVVETTDGWSVVDPDRYLYTEAMRAAKVGAGRRGGSTTAGRYEPVRGSDGRLAGVTEAPACVPPKQDSGPTEAYPSLPVPLGKGTRGNAFDGWSDEWSGFASAWQSRGFRLPPTEAQRSALWPIVDARPKDAAAWVRAAPTGSNAAAVVGYLLSRWKAVRGATA